VFDGKRLKIRAHKQRQQGNAKMVEKSGHDARQGRIVKGGMMLKILIASVVLAIAGFFLVSYLVSGTV
jgi:hypothetical protein